MVLSIRTDPQPHCTPQVSYLQCFLSLWSQNYARETQQAAIAQTISERAGPTAVEWEKVKHIVRRLFVEEKRPLRDVAVILNQDFSFHSTYVSMSLGEAKSLSQ